MTNNILTGLCVIAASLTVITFLNMFETEQSFERIDQQIAQIEVFAQQLKEGL